MITPTREQRQSLFAPRANKPKTSFDIMKERKYKSEKRKWNRKKLLLAVSEIHPQF